MKSSNDFINFINFIKSYEGLSLEAYIAEPDGVNYKIEHGSYNRDGVTEGAQVATYRIQASRL